MNGAYDIFLKIDGIAGESVHAKHKGEIVVLSHDQGITQTLFREGGGGIVAGRATFSPVRFRKPLDKASIPLMLAASSGRRIPKAVFAFRRQGGATLAFYKVTLHDVLVTAIRQMAGAGEQYPLSFTSLDTGEDEHGFLDEVELTFARIEWEYRGQDAKGALLPAVKGGWDLVTNKQTSSNPD